LVPEGEENDFKDMFDAELDMYDHLIPELEDLYAKNTAISPKFKPVHLKFPGNSVKIDYILLEDLRKKGYRNADRTQGLEQFEVEAALKKLAQWHAASAKRVVELGEYEKDIRESYFTAEHQKLLDEFNINFCMPFLECMQKYNLEPGQLVLIVSFLNILDKDYYNIMFYISERLHITFDGFKYRVREKRSYGVECAKPWRFLVQQFYVQI